MRGYVRALFGTPANAGLSLALLGLIAWLVPGLVRWAVAAATWTGANRRACAPDGACWAFIHARLGLFFYGGFPAGERWRVDLAAGLALVCILGCLFARRRGPWLVGLLLGLPATAGLLLAGGVLGLPAVPTTEWGGLMLNAVLSFVAVAVAVPFGTVLAYGRRSALPFVRGLSVIMVEFWRGVPLLAVLFMGSVLLPMMLPGSMTLDTLVRALVVLSLFTSAYMAEVVRGSLQGVPTGQSEAAAALGLTWLQIQVRIVIPQALRVSVPGIINIALDVFKDTTLVSVVGLFELMGVVNQSLRDQAWLGLANEAYLFAAATFFVCCLLISLAGSVLERRLR